MHVLKFLPAVGPFMNDSKEALDKRDEEEMQSTTPELTLIPAGAEDLSHERLIDLSVAVLMLQPHLGSLNANNWLGDMRRREPRYRQRLVSPPKWVKHGSKVKYPASEIERLIREWKASESEIALAA